MPNWTEAQPPGRAPLHDPGGLPSSADAAAGVGAFPGAGGNPVSLLKPFHSHAQSPVPGK